MMYTTLSALIGLVGEDMLIQITDRASPPAGAINASVVEQAIAGTQAAIDASLAVRYRLPLDSVPPAIADLAAPIALYKLHRFAPDEKIKLDYERALKDLGDFAAGRKKLDVAGIEPATSGAGGVLAIDRARPLTPESMAGFI